MKETTFPKRSTGFPVWAGYLIGALLIVIILFFGLSAIKNLDKKR